MRGIDKLMVVKMFFVALCLLLVTFSGCGDTEWWNKFRESAGLTVTHTGRYPNGNIKFQRTYWKGMLSGTSKEYYEDGQIKEIANYEDNVFHGERRVYSEEGQLLLRYTYKHGAADGPFEEFKFGPYTKKADGPDYIKKGLYKDGLLISEAGFAPDGRAISTELYEYEDRKIKKKTTNYQSDKSMTIAIYNNGLKEYEDIYDAEKNLIKSLNYDSLGRVNYVMKPEGSFEVIYDISEKQILGKWSADGNFYNADGKKIGHAGPDGKLILEE